MPSNPEAGDGCRDGGGGDGCRGTVATANVAAVVKSHMRS